MKQFKCTAINSFFGRVAASHVGSGHCCAVSHRIFRSEPVTQLRCRSLITYLSGLWYRPFCLLQASPVSGFFVNAGKRLVRLLGIFMAFSVLSVHAQADAQNSIVALKVSGAGNGETVIKVELAQPLANLPAGFTINTPPRIAFDFPDTTNGQMPV